MELGFSFGFDNCLSEPHRHLDEATMIIVLW